MIDRPPARIRRIGKLLSLRSLPIVERAAGFLQIFLDECCEFFLLRRLGRVPLQTVPYVFDPPLDSPGIRFWRRRLSDQKSRRECCEERSPELHLNQQEQDEDHAHVT